MNKLIRLSKTGIEYGDYAWNFASGCGNNIGGKCKAGDFRCWAYSISQRFGGHYPNGFKPTIYPEALCSPIRLKKASRILCAFMGDLFWECPEFDPDRKIHATMPSGKASVSMSLKGWIFTTIRQCPQHTFLFLTKQPQNLIKFSPFPDNCWVGVTATDNGAFLQAIQYLSSIKAKVRYLSIEPFLEPIYTKNISIKCLDWVIIGGQTKPTVMPKIEQVHEIVEACDKAGVKVFLKDSLEPLWTLENRREPFFKFSRPSLGATSIGRLRQEIPSGKATT